MALGLRHEDHDTICALASAPGLSALALIRTSGPRSYEIARRLCPALPAKLDSHRAVVATLLESASREPIDQAVILPFAEGRSFTGEESVEFSIHGSPTIVALLLRALVEAGCRMAMPGEYTYRAFMNGRLDLVQAESVLTLIESQSKEAARASLRQLKGDLSRAFAGLEDGVVWLLAQLEASIDFSAEGIEVIPSRDLLARIDGLSKQCADLLRSYAHGRLIQDGLSVALVGPPNVGKSSLLNAFLNDDRAIVTAEPGTTRDLVEGRFQLNGATVHMVDTAGLRETESVAERQGIARSREAARLADVVLAVLDGSQPWVPPAETDPDELAFALLINKRDLIGAPERLEDLKRRWTEARPGAPIFAVSALTGEGLAEVRSALEKRAWLRPPDAASTVLQARHFEVLKRIEMSLSVARRLIVEDASPDLIAFELQEAARGVHELLGQRFDEQVIDRIFKEFCLGK